MKADGLGVMFYPFVLMDIPAGNGLPDPWTRGGRAAAYPWRGRITARGRAGAGRVERPDRGGGGRGRGLLRAGGCRRLRRRGRERPVYRAGGVVVSAVDPALCASLRAGRRGRRLLHRLGAARTDADPRCGAPAIRRCVRWSTLAADVRAILGPGTKISYAADWTEYFGHHPADGSGDVFFHLDPLWATPAIDFVGIDNYMPLSDWRDEADHADAAARLDLRPRLSARQRRGRRGLRLVLCRARRTARRRTGTPITDGATASPGSSATRTSSSWWSQPHVNRVGGVKSGGADGVGAARSKPIWFTELGCPAVDKGANQPNVFHDPKSSESFLPYFSSGGRDDFIQRRYLQATFGTGTTRRTIRSLGRSTPGGWSTCPGPTSGPGTRGRIRIFPARIEIWSDGDELRARALAERPDVHDVARRSGGGDLRALRG